MNFILLALKLTFCTLLLTTTFVGAFAESNSFRSVKIELKQKSSVTGAHVYLSDVAKCFGNGAQCKEVSGIDLGLSPVAGRSQFIQKSTVESILDKEWPVGSFEMEGPDAVRVEAVAVEVNVDEVKMRLQDAMNERAQKLSTELRIMVLKVQTLGISNIRPTQSKIEFPDLENIQFQNPEWIAKNLVGGRMMQVRFLNPNDADDKSSVQSQIVLGVDRLLPVVKQSVMAGAMLSEANVQVQWVSLRRGLQDFAVSQESVIGRKTRQSLSAGEGIPVRYLESPVVVNRNQPVTMIVRKGDLEISSHALTVDQGIVGQTIDVVNAVNKRRMRAKVIDDKTVEAVAF